MSEEKNTEEILREVNKQFAKRIYALVTARADLSDGGHKKVPFVNKDDPEDEIHLSVALSYEQAKKDAELAEDPFEGLPSNLHYPVCVLRLGDKLTTSRSSYGDVPNAAVTKDGRVFFLENYYVIDLEGEGVRKDVVAGGLPRDTLDAWFNEDAKAGVDYEVIAFEPQIKDERFVPLDLFDHYFIGKKLDAIESGQFE